MQATTDNPTDLTLRLTRVFDAPPSLVFRAWTEGEHLRHWCFPRNFTVLDGDNDLRPGGSWHCRMRSPDGVEFVVGGVYREITAPTRLEFTHVWQDDAGLPGHETLVGITLEADSAGGTRMTFDQGVFASRESRDGHEGGWGESLDHLTAYLSGLPDEARRDLVVSRIVDAPPARVFQAWTDPAQLSRWWGPHGMTVPVCEMDLRPGGVFRTVMRAPDGKEYPNTGYFVELAEPERVSFTDKLDADGQPSREAFMLATTTFEPLPDGRTKLTARARHYSDANREKHEQMGFHRGWGEMLERLGDHVSAV